MVIALLKGLTGPGGAQFAVYVWPRLRYCGDILSCQYLTFASLKKGMPVVAKMQTVTGTFDYEFLAFFYLFSGGSKFLIYSAKQIVFFRYNKALECADPELDLLSDAGNKNIACLRDERTLLPTYRFRYSPARLFKISGPNGAGKPRYYIS